MRAVLLLIIRALHAGGYHCDRISAHDEGPSTFVVTLGPRHTWRVTIDKADA